MAIANRVLAITGLCTALTACGEQRLDNSELKVVTRAVVVAPGSAMVVPPLGGPPIVAVTQRSYENAISQEIRLATRGATPGENAIYATFFTAADVVDSDGVEGNLLKMPAFEDETAMREIEERFPGVAMEPSAVFVQNKYGPFSYAFGRGVGGEACLYAWQKLARSDSIFLPKSGAITIRIRLCDPRATEASLLRVAYDYSISASLSRPGWRPVDDAPPPAPRLGKPGAPIYPVVQPEAWETPEPAVSARAKPRQRSGAPRAMSSTPPAPDRRLEGYPVVPPPAANP